VYAALVDRVLVQFRTAFITAIVGPIKDNVLTYEFCGVTISLDLVFIVFCSVFNVAIVFVQAVTLCVCLTMKFEFFRSSKGSERHITPIRVKFREQLKTLVEEQPNSRFVDFEKTRAEVFHRIHAFITRAVHNTGIFLYRSVRLDVLNVIMQKYIYFC